MNKCDWCQKKSMERFKIEYVYHNKDTHSIDKLKFVCFGCFIDFNEKGYQYQDEKYTNAGTSTEEVKNKIPSIGKTKYPGSSSCIWCEGKGQLRDDWITIQLQASPLKDIDAQCFLEMLNKLQESMKTFIKETLN